MTKITDENDNLVEVESALDQPILETSALPVQNKLRDPEVEIPTDLDTLPVEEEAPAPALDPALVAAVRKQVMKELESETERTRYEKIQAREEAKEAHDAYVETMKKSSDPWVDIQGWVHTEQGVRVELDWNDAFVEHLKTEGITGADDDQVVQQWVTLLLRDMTTQLEGEQPEKSEYS